MSPAVASRSERVLVCDDDRLVLATVAHGLRSAGFAVLEADNGDDAILLAREHRPDLALLDVRMSGKSGMDVAAYLRDHVGTPFMFLSAFSDEAVLRQAAEVGALAYLVKPLDVLRIVPEVRAALARSSRPAAPPDQAPPQPVGAGNGLDPVAIAVGVLAERLRLRPADAHARLGELAGARGCDERTIADEIVAAAALLSAAPSRPA